MIRPYWDRMQIEAPVAEENNNKVAAENSEEIKDDPCNTTELWRDKSGGSAGEEFREC